MLRELITSDVIRIHSDATDWKDAVSKSCEALIENGAIEQATWTLFTAHTKSSVLTTW